MDVALEFCDKYIFDHLYAALLPSTSLSPDINNGLSNSSTWDPKSTSSWQYVPATQFISFEPTQAAYASQWPRDNIYRQGISLFWITWYVQIGFFAFHMSNVVAGLPAHPFTSLSRRYPTSLSSTRPHTNTQSSSRTKSKWRLLRLSIACLELLCSPRLSF